jgi:bifunctional lysine-specific demethylase and histidyl-hydroxylase NO66
VLAESSYTRGGTLAGKPLTGLVDPVRLLRLFDEGATVVLQGLQRYHPPLADLVAELELELGHPCQANAYLTPPGAQGFAVHSDSHDVFVFQTHGSKQWEVHGTDGPGDLVLEPGVVAYLPTGTPHAARAQETTSLHVTIGINQLTWRGLVDRLVREAVASVPDDHLPAGWLDEPSELEAGLRHHLRDVAERVASVDAARRAEDEVRRFLTTRPARATGALRDRVAVSEGIGADTRLLRRTGVPCRLVPEPDGRLRVLLGDRSLVVPDHLRPALEEVARREELTPRDLTGLDLESALVLARRLVREGLLRVG